ncbi:MAG: hypothetical protein KDD70_15590, partial [Bdellovibrionales bacterium]|nr:hypothetical protein [Bdellovibrionales bacterium]
ACLPFGCFDCEWSCRFGNEPCLGDLDPTVITRAVKAALQADQSRMKVMFRATSRNESGSAEEAHMSLFGDSSVELIPVAED